MGQEIFLLQQLLGGSGLGWTPVALLVCLFLVLILRPERIQKRARFKTACWLLTLSIIAPPIMNVLTLVAMSPLLSPYSRQTLVWPVVHGLAGVVGPALVGVGAFLGLTALMPSEPRTPFSDPPRHPLE